MTIGELKKELAKIPDDIIIGVYDQTTKKHAKIEKIGFVGEGYLDFDIKLSKGVL